MTCYTCGLDFGNAGPTCPECGSHCEVCPECGSHCKTPLPPSYPAGVASDDYSQQFDDAQFDRERYEDWAAEKNL